MNVSILEKLHKLLTDIWQDEDTILIHLKSLGFDLTDFDNILDIILHSSQESIIKLVNTILAEPELRKKYDSGWEIHWVPVKDIVDSMLQLLKDDSYLVNGWHVTIPNSNLMPTDHVSPRDKLDSLKKRIATLENFSPNLFNHLTQAIEGHETSQYLGSTLIAAKVVDFILDNLDGSKDEEKIDFLVNKGVLDRRLKDNFLRGLQKSRNYYTHDINIIPYTEEALGILSIACELAIKFSQVK